MQFNVKSYYLTKIFFQFHKKIYITNNHQTFSRNIVYSLINQYVKHIFSKSNFKNHLPYMYNFEVIVVFLHAEKMYLKVHIFIRNNNVL